MRQAARHGPRGGGEKAGAALVIIPSGRHCADRRETGSEKTHNPSFQSRAFLAIFCCFPALGRSSWDRPPPQEGSPKGPDLSDFRRYLRLARAVFILM